MEINAGISRIVSSSRSVLCDINNNIVPTMIEQFKDFPSWFAQWFQFAQFRSTNLHVNESEWKFFPPPCNGDPDAKDAQPPKNENNDTEEKLASVQHTLVILSLLLLLLLRLSAQRTPTRNSTKPRARVGRGANGERVCKSRQAQWEVGPIVANALLDKVGRK